MTNLDQMESEKSRFFSILLEIMGKHGLVCTYMKTEEHYWSLDLKLRQKKYQLTFALPTGEKNTLFSIFQDLERLRENCTKQSKKLRMEWSLTGDTQDIVVTLEESF